MRGRWRTARTVAVLGFHAKDPSGYGRLLVKDGALTAIREEKDARRTSARSQFCNAGLMAISGAQALSRCWRRSATTMPNGSSI